MRGKNNRQNRNENSMSPRDVHRITDIFIKLQLSGKEYHVMSCRHIISTRFVLE